MHPSTVQRTIWVDTEDLFNYAVANPRPSGVQRLVFEILRVLPERARLIHGNLRIAFVRHTNDDRLIAEVPFDSVAKLFQALSGHDVAPARRGKSKRTGTTASFNTRVRSWMVRAIQRLPSDVADPLLQAGALQMAALRQCRTLLTGQARAMPRRDNPNITESNSPRAELMPEPGDIFLILGAAWVHTDYGVLLRRLCTLHGVKPALLLYDLIPLRRPEWCVAELVTSFSAWLKDTIPQCPILLAISRATATDVEMYARESSILLHHRVMPIPMGTGFGLPVAPGMASGVRPRGLPARGSYALFVSTLEARKNHILLFRVWRRLLSELPHERVPTLVFAGRVGWLVADLMQQLENAGWLDGKIRLLRDPSDAELIALYEGCRFTLFPSLYEGWGLPVTESLALGRPCISSNRASLPEAGGDLARYFDPENFDDAYRAVKAVIDDPEGLDYWRASVARNFRHVPWSHTADVILATCLSAVTQPSARDASA